MSSKSKLALQKINRNFNYQINVINKNREDGIKIEGGVKTEHGEIIK